MPFLGKSFFESFSSKNLRRTGLKPGSVLGKNDLRALRLGELCLTAEPCSTSLLAAAT